MTKLEFLENLESGIMNNSRKTPIGLLRFASDKDITLDNMNEILYEITGDDNLTNEIVNMCSVFRYCNKVFVKHMFNIIDEAKIKREY